MGSVDEAGSVVRSPISEKLELLCPPKMCWVSQLAQRSRTKSISDRRWAWNHDSAVSLILSSHSFYSRRKCAKIYWLINHSAADWSISVKFGTDFDHVTMYYNRSRSNVSWSRSQRENVKIIALFQEIGVAKSNGDIRTVIGSCKIAVCTHIYVQSDKNDVVSPSSCNASLV